MTKGVFVNGVVDCKIDLFNNVWAMNRFAKYAELIFSTTGELFPASKRTHLCSHLEKSSYFAQGQLRRTPND